MPEQEHSPPCRGPESPGGASRDSAPAPGPAAAAASAAAAVAPAAAPDRAAATGRDGRNAGDRLPPALLALLAALPAFAVLPGFGDGAHLFTLYREPKLAVAQALLWGLLVAVAWRRPPLVETSALRSALGRPPVVLLVLFVGWSAATALWVEVPPNLLYELIQYLPLAALLAVLVAWGERDRRLRLMIARALAASLGALTLIGFLQLLAPIPWLPPIDPEYGVPNPSLMGYKNPMALALLGQIHLVAWLAASDTRRLRLAWAVLLGAELVYLATLQSRTAYLALALSALLLVAVAVARRGVSRRRRGLVLASALAGVVLFAGAVALHPGARARFASAVRHAASPADYLASDRGTYLLNTLHMAAHRPLGVGLGDWQSWYPLFRRHDRYRAFTEVHQARRAHSDLVQLLGETGWPGLALWVGFLAAAVAGALRRFLRGGDLGSLFAGAQLAALAVAMAGDYVVEMPYHKLQLVLVAALATIRPPGSPAMAAAAPAGPRRARSRGAFGVAVAVTLMAAVAIGWTGATLIRSEIAARLEHRYLAMTALAARGGGAGSDKELERLAATGERLLRWPGHTKTLYKDLLILAHVSALRGEPQRAEAFARRSLDLHPHYPNALGVLGRLLDERDPAAAAAFRRARIYVLHEARDGRPPALPAGGAR